jgi:hypothetical protein
MDRKEFLRVSSIFAGFSVLPSLQCNMGKSKDSVIYKPDILSEICDEKTIRQIGVAYLKKSNPVLDEKQLLQKLLQDSDGKDLSPNISSSHLFTILTKKIESDYVSNNYMILNGWIISETEAIQCALFTYRI